MRRALLALPLLVASTLSGCSIRWDFVVVNESDETIEVRYTFKGRGLKDCCDPPSRQTLRRFEDEDKDGWGMLADGEYSYDAAARAVTVSLAPKEVLRILTVSDAAGDPRAAGEFFPVGSIRMAGAGGSVEYAGRAARTQFAELDGRSAFAITYR